MSSPVGPHWCESCQTRAAEAGSKHCVRCKALWHNAVPASGHCVHCHEGTVEPGDIYCWHCNEELMHAAFGGDEPPCND